MRTLPALLVAVSSLSLCLLSAPARAQLSLSVTPTPVSANPGEILQFTGVLSNVGANPIDLMGFSGSFVGPGSWLSFDDTDFFTNAPFSLLAGSSYTEFLYVNVSPSAAPGLYTGTYEVEGDEAGTSWFGSGSVNVTVNSIIPEPASLALVGLPAGVGAWIFRRRSAAR